MATTTLTPSATTSAPPAPEAALLRLRPRDVAGLFDQAVWLYRRNFRAFLGIAAVVQLPVNLILVLATAWLIDPLAAVTDAGRSGDPLDAQQATITAFSDFLSRMSIILVISVVGSLLLILAEGALARAIADRYLGRPVTVRGAYRAIRPQAGWLMLTVFVQSLISYLILLPPLFVYVYVAWSFVSQVIVLENTNIITGLQRSWRLVQGQWWRTAGMNGLVLLLSVIIVLPSTVVSVIMGAAGAPLLLTNFASQFVTVALGLLFLPARLAAFTLMYYDLRIRKEGYDLEVALAERLGGGPPGAGGWGSGVGGENTPANGVVPAADNPQSTLANATAREGT
jgi:hypothetical protein